MNNQAEQRKEELKALEIQLNKILAWDMPHAQVEHRQEAVKHILDLPQIKETLRCSSSRQDGIREAIEDWDSAKAKAEEFAMKKEPRIMDYSDYAWRLQEQLNYIGENYFLIPKQKLTEGK